MLKYIRKIFFFFTLLLANPFAAYGISTSTISVCQNNFTEVDTIAVEDTLANNVKKKTTGFYLKEKHNNEVLPLYSVDKKNIDNRDYRYTGNLLSGLPFSYLLDLGLTNQPNEAILYGLGYGSCTLRLNDKSINNKNINSINLNRVQSEGIGKLNLYPPTKGFLFNMMNNPVTINISESDSFKSKPLSRIRYYQASDEGYVDVMFSSKIYSNAGMSFRITNIADDAGFTNSKTETWKANFKAYYKISDNIFTKLSYHHLRSKFGLNGGINPASLENIDQNSLSDILYNRKLAVVTFTDRYNINTVNNITVTSFLKVLGKEFIKIVLGYENVEDKFFQNTNVKGVSDSMKINNVNSYNSLFGKVQHKVTSGNFIAEAEAEMEMTDFDVDYLNYYDKQTNYYAWALIGYKFFNNSLIPSFFGKTLNYNNKNFNGYGVDIIYSEGKNISLDFGYSAFEKPFSLNERQLLSNNYKNNTQNISTLFFSAYFKFGFTHTGVSYFEITNNNKPVAVFNSADIKNTSSGIVYPFTSEFVIKGVNINSTNKLGNFLFTLNSNYYFDFKTDDYLSPDFSLFAGLYYVDTLYNANLKLKTGVNLYYSKNLNNKNSNKYVVYDFQQMRSTSKFISGSGIENFSVPLITNNKIQLDFFLAGRIRNAATVYFVFENIFDNNYFIVPFYPMRERGVRIGVSWDFIN